MFQTIDGGKRMKDQKYLIFLKMEFFPRYGIFFNFVVIKKFKSVLMFGIKIRLLKLNKIGKAC